MEVGSPTCQFISQPCHTGQSTDWLTSEDSGDLTHFLPDRDIVVGQTAPQQCTMSDYVSRVIEAVQDVVRESGSQGCTDTLQHVARITQGSLMLNPECRLAAV